MKTFYPSQIQNEEFFWLQDVKTGTWILAQQNRLKNGQIGQTWRERSFIRKPPADITEENLLAVFAQLETDIIFRDAAGIKSGISHTDSLRNELDKYTGSEPEDAQ